MDEEATPLLGGASDDRVHGWAYYWSLLLVCIAGELFGTICMQQSEGFKNVWPSIGIFVGYGVSFSILPLVLQGIDLSIAYAVWSSAGIALTTLWGFAVAGEQLSPVKVACLVGILVCVAGLKYAEGQQEQYREPALV